MGRGRRANHRRPQLPVRRCVGCRQAKPQAELLRLTAQDGAVVVSENAPGRGCYLCRDAKCAGRAAKSRQIGRALKGKAAEPPVGQLLSWLGLLDGSGA